MTNIAIGQFYPVDSSIHRLDPRVKLVSTFLIITLLFIVTNGYGFLVTALFLCVIIYLSNVPPSFIFKGLRGILFILLFTVVLNAFFSGGETVLFRFYAIVVTQEGLISAGKVAARLIMLVLFSSILTLTTSPIALTDAIEFLLNPFRRIGVPAHEIAMMMTIALRFIPTLLEEIEKIMKAQTARGADFATGGLIKKAKSLIPLLVPLFVSAFRRADELAMAMESRCYRGSEGRTRMKVLKLAKADFYAMGVLACFTALFLSTTLL